MTETPNSLELGFLIAAFTRIRCPIRRQHAIYLVELLADAQTGSIPAFPRKSFEDVEGLTFGKN